MEIGGFNTGTGSSDGALQCPICLNTDFHAGNMLFTCLACSAKIDMRTGRTLETDGEGRIRLPPDKGGGT